MGRYSSVQAYADNNANARTVSYEQATGSNAIKGGVVKPEKVVNPYGSTAGAGSGEFHVYRHARAREMERLKMLEQEDEEARKDREFQEKLERDRQEELEKTEKRRKKRQRQKEAKIRKKNLEKAGITTNLKSQTYLADDEFTYEPENNNDDTGQAEEEPAKKQAKLDIPNDGSFLERMKKQLEQEENVDSHKIAVEELAQRKAGEGEDVDSDVGCSEPALKSDKETI